MQPVPLSAAAQTRPAYPVHQAPARSQGALQRVVVVLETLQLQEVFGTFALLAGRKVGDLNGAGVGDFRGQSEVFHC